MPECRFLQPNIEIYSSAWCPFCAQALNLLDSKQVEYTKISVDGEPELRAQMMQRSGRRTVPQIFIDDDAIGGCDDLLALERSGELDRLLKQA